jgi:hypothetical protein
MKKNELQVIEAALDQLRSHLLIFETHFPEIVKGARMRGKAHLTVFSECFPALKRMVNFAEIAIPAIEHMIESVPQSFGDIPQAASNLGKVTEATELATTEIMDVVDGATERLSQQIHRIAEVMDPNLKGVRAHAEQLHRISGLLSSTNGKVSAASVKKALKILHQQQDVLDVQNGKVESTYKEVVDSLEGIKDLMFQIMDALQFQDITAQQIEATKAILSKLDGEIRELSEDFAQGAGGASFRFHTEGVFDPEAAYDHQRAQQRQREADGLFEQGKSAAEAEETAPEVIPSNSAKQTACSPPASQTGVSAPPVEVADPVDASAGASEAMGQDDIDALFG